ncbi:nitroreductase family deazaflavin-dependent oxidoreductase [Actinotalea sp. K2]|uniref:nitroreductase family deazaflavin-dependent oxidoreductase n=1 Tax=Actinotalea sp. K2 TaxID=2939438 RepID=UPI0020172400|nr:nitroreductase family deazaflavin-dependent oxidoreductase [Actinotalea sp. K2]MCL3862927.1 nitroreductase family deazaflavin-dependent oxidoreductase [Actinotalea sp. K2]
MISRRTQTRITRFHTWLYRRTGGRLGGRLGSMEQVLLTTTGRSSGQPRVTPLTGIPHGDDLLLVASDGGNPHHPQWYKNILVHDEVAIQRGREHLTMRARTATPEERAVLWPVVVGVYRGYAQYQERTDRQIPVVVCRPV